MATIHAIRTHSRESGLRRAEKAVGAAGLMLGEAAAVLICAAELIFFCAYIVVLPFMVVMALGEIPDWLRKHVQMR